MLILTILKNIFDIKRILTELHKFYKFLKKNKIINFWTASAFVLSTWLLYYSYKEIILSNNVNYLQNERRLSIEREIKKYLLRCGDKTAISLGSVSTQKSPDQQFYNGIFEQAMACDFEANKDDCIVNLFNINSAYTDYKKIDLSSYNLFETISLGEYPYFFNLRKDNKQNLEGVMLYPFIHRMLSETIWGIKGQLYSLRVVSIENYNHRIIYIITLVTGAIDTSCIADRELQSLKQFIQKL